MLKKRLIAAATLACMAGLALAEGRCGTHPWCNTSLSPQARADLVLAALSTQQKVSLLGGDNVLSLIESGTNDHTGVNNGAPGVGVPAIYYTDGPPGIRQGSSTAMPAGIALAATWNTALANEYGATVGNEAMNKGNDVLFGPTVDILRTPQAGRTFESYGEDPFLAASLGTRLAQQGAQDQGVIATMKHYIDNSQEGLVGQNLEPLTGVVGGRMFANVQVGERTQREIYMPAFEAAVVTQGNAGAVMCSYNKINGEYGYARTATPCSTSSRGSWNFQGYVIADYGAAHDTLPAFDDGLDFEPWPPEAYQPARLDHDPADRTSAQ